MAMAAAGPLPLRLAENRPGAAGCTCTVPCATTVELLVTRTVAIPVATPVGTMKLICDGETKMSRAGRAVLRLSVTCTETPPRVVGKGRVVANVVWVVSPRAKDRKSVV